MNIGWTRFAVAAYLLTGLCVVGARAQGDPNEAVRSGDGGGEEAWDDGADRPDWRFDANGPRGVWAGILREPDGQGGLREHGAGWNTRSFRLGITGHALQTKPDYMLIQFGHNDVVFNRPPGCGCGYAGHPRRRVLEPRGQEPPPNGAAL